MQTRRSVRLQALQNKNCDIKTGTFIISAGINNRNVLNEEECSSKDTKGDSESEGSDWDGMEEQSLGSEELDNEPTDEDDECETREAKRLKMEEVKKARAFSGGTLKFGMCQSEASQEQVEDKVKHRARSKENKGLGVRIAKRQFQKSTLQKLGPARKRTKARSKFTAEKWSESSEDDENSHDSFIADDTEEEDEELGNGTNMPTGKARVEEIVMPAKAVSNSEGSGSGHASADDSYISMQRQGCTRKRKSMLVDENEADSTEETRTPPVDHEMVNQKDLGREARAEESVNNRSPLAYETELWEDADDGGFQNSPAVTSNKPRGSKMSVSRRRKTVIDDSSEEEAEQDGDKGSDKATGSHAETGPNAPEVDPEVDGTYRENGNILVGAEASACQVQERQRSGKRLCKTGCLEGRSHLQDATGTEEPHSSKSGEAGKGCHAGRSRRMQRKDNVLERLLAHRRQKLGIEEEQDKIHDLGNDTQSREGEGTEGTNLHEGEEDEGADGGDEESKGNMDGSGSDSFIVADEDGETHGYNNEAESGAAQQVAELEEEEEDVLAVTELDFKIYMQYLLECIQDESFAQTCAGDPELKAYFSPKIRKVEETVTHRRAKVVTSEAWRSDIKHALEVRPKLVVFDADHTKNDCDACGRKNHPAPYLMSFSGAPCDSGMLWEFNFKDNKGAHGAAKRKEAAALVENEEYQVGRFCLVRCRTFYILQHYKSRLIERLRSDFNSAEVFVERRKEEKPNGDTVMEILEQSTVVSALYKNFKQMVNAADDFGSVGLTRYGNRQDLLLEQLDHLEEALIQNGNFPVT